jgi:hypothetical protein
MATPKNNRYVPPKAKAKIPALTKAPTPQAKTGTVGGAARLDPKPKPKSPTIGSQLGMARPESQPKMMNKPAGPAPQVKAQRLAKEKDAIAARAKAKGLNPSKADIDATYKRNRQRITASRRAAMKNPKP